VNVFVVDASLVIKWFVPEIHSDAARRWLDASHHYVAPDLLFPEVGNAVWKKVRRDELTPAEGQQVVAALSRVAVEAVAMGSLLPDAVALAVGAGITVYDAMYLALAVRLDTQVITGDDRFADKTAPHPLLAPHVRRLQDFVDSRSSREGHSRRLSKITHATKYMINVDRETRHVSGGSSTGCRSTMHKRLGRHFDLTVHALGCASRRRGVHGPSTRYWDDNDGAGYGLDAVVKRVEAIQRERPDAHPRRCRRCGVEAYAPVWD
jgi:predicted nucleic acid-binding protein